jgi:hypothetical protein
MKCSDELKVKSIIFFNPKDVKEISKEKGIVLKRKYGKFKRKIFEHKTKKNEN